MRKKWKMTCSQTSNQDVLTSLLWSTFPWRDLTHAFGGESYFLVDKSNAATYKSLSMLSSLWYIIHPERTLNHSPCLVSDIVWIWLGNLTDRQHCHNLCRRPARDPRQNIYVQTFPIALFIFFKIYEREYYLQQEWILSEEAGFCILNLLLPIPIGEYLTPSRMVSTDYWQIQMISPVSVFWLHFHSIFLIFRRRILTSMDWT